MTIGKRKEWAYGLNGSVFSLSNHLVESIVKKYLRANYGRWVQSLWGKTEQQNDEL